MANKNLTNAKRAKNYEFYTQFSDIQKKVESYLEHDPNTYKGKENFWFLLPRPKGAGEASIIGHQGSARNAVELCSIHTAFGPPKRIYGVTKHKRSRSRSRFAKETFTNI